MPVERSTAGSSRTGGQSHGRGRQRGGAQGNRSQRGRGGGGRGRGGRRGGTRPVDVPYSPPTYPPAATLNLYATNDPGLQTKLSQPGIKRIRFGDDFQIEDSHLQTMSAIPGLMNTLEVLSLGDSDTGNGAYLTDAGVQLFLSQSPHLISLTLDACTRLKNATLIHALESCPRLQHLRITGNDKVKGGITDAVFKTLRERADLGTNLKELVLYDQSVDPFRKDFKAFSKARKELTIREGETLGDGIADNMIAAMTGGSSLSAWKGGKMVGMDVDMGIYGPGGYDMPFYDF
ncbi:hypothetical protein V5O48_012677 [Marasmius crinis-equi]|uniref:Uncharacterized protein n=1 Tax=Marasmius crinis-equi TaxID=585013 RepID=A0ABR3F277_9AGAR